MQMSNVRLELETDFHIVEESVTYVVTDWLHYMYFHFKSGQEPVSIS